MKTIFLFLRRTQTIQNVSRSISIKRIWTRGSFVVTYFPWWRLNLNVRKWPFVGRLLHCFGNINIGEWTPLTFQCRVSWTGMNTPLHTHTHNHTHQHSYFWKRSLISGTGGLIKRSAHSLIQSFTPGCWIQHHRSTSLLTSSPILKHQGENSYILPHLLVKVECNYFRDVTL